MKEYAVWSEGYRVSGAEGTARLHGSAVAASFQEACDMVLGELSQYDRSTRTYWGCRLFDNEQEARASFG